MIPIRELIIPIIPIRFHIQARMVPRLRGKQLERMGKIFFLILGADAWLLQKKVLSLPSNCGDHNRLAS
jgi:hypothetical protein